MAVVVDSSPLIAAVNRRDDFHLLAAKLVATFGRELIVPDPVAVEVDWMLRDRIGSRAARIFLEALVAGVHQRVPLSPSLFAAATTIDSNYADLGLGLVDASVMAVAEATDSAILTFDFTHFRAAAPRRGRPWRLVIDESEFEKWHGARREP